MTLHVHRRVITRVTPGEPGQHDDLFERLERKGTHVVFTKDLSGWTMAENSPERVLFRPGWDAGRRLVGYGALAAGLSLVFYWSGAWGGIGYTILHAALWLVAVSWPLSIFTQKLALRRDGATGIVHVHGRGILFPYHRRYPVGGAPMSLTKREHYETRGRRSRFHTGWDWLLLLLGEPPLELLMGFTPGEPEPDQPPYDVRESLRAISRVFRSPIEGHTE
jgi:hypothetical protein